MTNEEKRKAIRKYFAPFPNWAIWLILIGVLVSVVGANQSSGEVAVTGFIILAIGGMGIYIHFKGMPSDKEMDKFIAEDLSVAKSRSLQKSLLDESELVGEPLVITGPRIWNRASTEWLYKKGEDGILRFTPIDVIVINMTQHQLVIYQACLDLTTGNYLNESTDEYFYKDVVSVSIKTRSKTYDTIQLNEAEVFTIVTSGGTSVDIILKDPKLIEMMGGGEIPTTEAERAIRVVRKMLREKKQS